MLLEIWAVYFVLMNPLATLNMTIDTLMVFAAWTVIPLQHWALSPINPWATVLRLLVAAAAGIILNVLIFIVGPCVVFLSLGLPWAFLRYPWNPDPLDKWAERILWLYFTLTIRKDVFEVRRRKRMERRGLEEQYEKLKREEEAVRSRLEERGESHLEEFFRHLQSLEAVPTDITDYHGYIGEVYQRWVERQKQRTLQVTRDRIQELANLYRAWADVQRQKIEMARAYAATKRVHTDIEIDALEQEVRKEKALTQRAQLEVERARLEQEQAALRAQGTRGVQTALPLILGKTVDEEGIPKSVSLPPELRRRHVYIIGTTQTGKTTLIERMVLQDIEAGQGCALIDPHGDAALRLLTHIPSQSAEDVVYLDFTSDDPVVAFNPLDAPLEQRAGIVEDFLSYFGQYFATDAQTAPRMTHILRYSLLTLLASGPHRTIADVETLLTDAEFRKRVVREVEEPKIVRFWEKEFPDLKRVEVQPILTRFSALLAPGSQLSAILTQPESRLDFKEILNGGKVLIVRLSKARGMTEATPFLAALIVTRVQQEAMSRAEAERRPFYLYVDEFQNYTVASFETIVTETAKFRLSVTMANQTLAVLPAALKSIVCGAGAIVAFRVNAEDAAAIQKEMRKRVLGWTPSGTLTEKWYPEVDDLQNLNRGEAFVTLGRPDTVQKVETYRLPPPAPQTAAQNIITASHRRYYRPRRREEGDRGDGGTRGRPSGQSPKDFLE